jgi:hypothetical protein
VLNVDDTVFLPPVIVKGLSFFSHHVHFDPSLASPWQLVALAGFEVWRGTIAHISAITHLAFRRRGFLDPSFICIAQARTSITELKEPCSLSTFF